MMKRLSSLLAFATTLVLLGGAIACQQEKAPEKNTPPAEKHDHDHDHDHDHSGHHHEAPNGGTLVVLGDHFAHLEFVLEPPKNRLLAWVLDGHADKPIRVTQESMTVIITPNGKAPIKLEMAAVADPLTGETVGDTSHFSATNDALDGLEKFEVTIEGLTVKGEELTMITFPFPEGNEGK